MKPLRARIVAVKTAECYLEPGDLYSTQGPEYWVRAMKGSVLAQAMIVPNDAVFESNTSFVFRLTIVKENGAATERNKHVVAPEFNPHLPPGESSEL